MRITTLSPNARPDGPMAQPPFVTIPEDSTQNNTLFNEDAEDNIGSLYYVVTVIFIYGFSIVLMIASHIRKNQQDNQLRTYLKEMALLRKKDRREKIMGRMTTINTAHAVCTNFHNATSGAGALSSNHGSGQALLNNANVGISSRSQQPMSTGCTFASINIGSCPYGIHVNAVNVGQIHSNTNAQNVSQGNYPKSNQSPFLNDGVANSSNTPLVTSVQPSTVNGPQCGPNSNILPVAPLTPTATSNNGNNNCSASSTLPPSNSSTNSVTVAAITATPSSTTSDTISTPAVASTSTCDSAISNGPGTSFAECMQQNQHNQQNYRNNHHKVDEAEEIMLLQAQLSKIQLHQKQQQQQQQQQMTSRCLDPILPPETNCVNEATNRGKSPIETNIQIISENVIT